MPQKGVSPLEKTKHKISESVKANWIIRKQKYGNSEGCKNPEARHKKISMATKGRPGIKGRPAWNKGTKGKMPPPWTKGLTKETSNKLRLAGEKAAKTKKERGMPPIWNKGLKYKTKPHSKEWRKNISESHLKFHRENPGKGGWAGKHLPDEMKLKLRRASAVRLSKQPHKNTKPELALANILNSLEIKYEQQVPIDTSIPDFFIQPNICIFVDGKYWHNRPEVKERDTRINQSLKKLDYKVMRFWDNEIFNESQNVINGISKLEINGQREASV